jgi:putative cardiolipin synthase
MHRFTGATKLGYLALLMALGGCSTLPLDARGPSSTALDEVSDMPLAQIARAATPASARGLSGFRLLPVGDQSFDARVALARRARKSLDVQYYLIGQDDIGLHFLRELRDAARRGVRVRLLVDDLYTAGEDELLVGLAAYPNVEVRLFNPLPERRGGFATRMAFSLHEWGRINHRMHNKLFIADNSFSVSGGRNMADEYFWHGKAANFVDIDVISTGPVVRQFSSVFDGFWNSEHVYPIESVATTPLRGESARIRFDELVRKAAPLDAPMSRDPLGRSTISEQLESGHLDEYFGSADVLADSPDKVDGLKAGTSVGTMSYDTVNVMRSAQSEVVIASPYFIPGQRGLELMKEAVARGIRLVVITNSLGTSDEPLAQRAYSRYRRAMLRLGVAIYELSPALGPRLAQPGDMRIDRLHAKVATIDHRRVFIGSMNLDPRSARLNTELGLVIDARDVAADLERVIRQDDFESMYRLRLSADAGSVEWVSTRDGKETVQPGEPNGGRWSDFKLWLMSLFVAEDQL